MKHLFTVLIIALIINKTYSQSTPQMDVLRHKIGQIIQNKKADVGIAVLGIEDRDSLTFNKNKNYPMQSVYKFHLALAVLNQIDKGKLALNQPVLLTKRDLLPNTWSPMRDKYADGNVELPLSDILSYSVSKSDNNACDVLFRLVGGTQKVHKYIRKLGIKDVSIAATEAEMDKDWSIQFTNTTRPFSAVQLLDKFYTTPILSKETHDFLWKILVETTTGPNKIKGLLPAETIVGHKTGASGTNKAGITGASNDVGIVTLPNGKHFAIAIFVANSSENSATNDAIIAEITKAVWDYYVAK